MKRPNYQVIKNDIIKTFSQSMERQNKRFRYGAIAILIILELRTPKWTLTLSFSTGLARDQLRSAQHIHLNIIFVDKN